MNDVRFTFTVDRGEKLFGSVHTHVEEDRRFSVTVPEKRRIRHYGIDVFVVEENDEVRLKAGYYPQGDFTNGSLFETDTCFRAYGPVNEIL